MMGDHFEGSLTKEQAHHGTENESTKRRRSRMTIYMLPDVVLLEIFDFYMDKAWIKIEWHRLVHVCRKWRNVIFESPHRLNLRLYCGARTPVRTALDVWPQLPIVIDVPGLGRGDVDNIVAALKHNNRICTFNLFDTPSSQLEKVLAAMQQPFPELTRLQLCPGDETVPVIPASFLGGSAPLLRELLLDRVPFPGLPKLLLSATLLVRLHLSRIPDPGYISPESMVTGLSVLTSLEILEIGFESPRSRPDQRSRRPPPLTRTLLPTLTEFQFKGVDEYLEDLVARIDAPLLNNLTITFFHQLIFDTPRLSQFISRAPNFKAHGEVHVAFSDSDVSVTLPQTFDGTLHLVISCSRSDWQLSALAQICSSSFPQALTLAVEHLYILAGVSPRLRWKDHIESGQWLELFHLFTTVKYLYISQEFTPRIAFDLQELVGARATEVLPALKTLFLGTQGGLPSGPVRNTEGGAVHDPEWEHEWEPVDVLCLSKALDALPAHILNPFTGSIPPINLLDKIARGIAQAKSPCDWPYSQRSTRAKLVELSRVRAREVSAEQKRHNITEEGGIDQDPAQFREVLKPTTIIRRPLYRQNGFDFMQSPKLELRRTDAFSRTSHRALSELSSHNPTYHLPARSSHSLRSHPLTPLRHADPFGETPESMKLIVRQFVAARQLAGHPIAVLHWERNCSED